MVDKDKTRYTSPEQILFCDLDIGLSTINYNTSNFLIIYLASNLVIERTKNPNKKPANVANLPFGSMFTDHMLEIDWTAKDGWQNPKIKPFQDLSLVSFYKDASAWDFHIVMHAYFSNARSRYILATKIDHF